MSTAGTPSSPSSEMSAQRQLPAAPENQIYLPLAPARELTLMVRAAADPGTLAGPLREAVQSIDPSIPVTTNTMDAVYGWYTRDRRLQGVIIGVLGVIAMLLAALGVYGTMALLVTERSREIAIRMALGSSNRPSCAWCSGAGSVCIRRRVCGRPAGVRLHGVSFVDLPRLARVQPGCRRWCRRLLATVAIGPRGGLRVAGCRSIRW